VVGFDFGEGKAMNVRAILSICFKVVGVYYVIWSIRMFLQSVTQLLFFNQGYDAFYIITGFVFLIMVLVIALILIFNSDRIAQYLQPLDETLAVELPADFGRTALVVGVQLFGVATVLASITDMSRLVSYLRYLKWELNPFFDMNDKVMLVYSVVSVILYLGIGFYLMLRPHGVVRLMTRGKEEPQMEEEKINHE